MLVPHFIMFLLQAKEAWLNQSADVAKMYPTVTRKSHTNLNSKSLYMPDLKMVTKKLPRMLPALRSDDLDRSQEKRPISSIYDMLYGKRVKIDLSSAGTTPTPTTETAGTRGRENPPALLLKQDYEVVNDISQNAFMS